MGRRYYCEYCDKTFIDELEARRKHLQSANHIKLRNMHYEQCRGNFLFVILFALTQLYNIFLFRTCDHFKRRAVEDSLPQVFSKRYMLI